MILVIDNYDSFTYNLVQYFGELGADWSSGGTMKSTLDEIANAAGAHLHFARPCTPLECRDQQRSDPGSLGRRSPILGVCLGHQCIGHVFGGEVVRADRLDARQDLADPS